MRTSRSWSVLLVAIGVSWLSACGGSGRGAGAGAGVDDLGPTPGTVSDGVPGDDIEEQESTTEFSAHWAGFLDDATGVVSYEWAIGATPGGTEVLAWTEVGGELSATATGLQLEPGIRYYAAVRGKDGAGNTGGVAISNGALVSLRVKPLVLGQFGITWRFDAVYESGQFANGDWWVVGPANILAIEPVSAEVGGRTMNGSMIDPAVTTVDQGYDSSMYAGFAPGSYRRSLNVAFDLGAATPLVLRPGNSLVSTISMPQPGAIPQLRTAAVLTCVASAPAPGSFRPAYAGGANKSVRFNKSQLAYSFLGKLPPVPATPSLASIERDFERPWIDHTPGWLGRYLHPADNMPDYGRDLASEVGAGALMLHLSFSDQQKERLLIRCVQLGIDCQGIVDAGGRNHWEPAGGHGSGRKWPILFAGIMLGDPTMAAIGSNKAVLFGEDAQTFVVQETSPGRYNYGHGGYQASDVGTPEWGNRHAVDPSQDVKDWEVDPYRTCCTANAWSGFVFAAIIMGQRNGWNHPPLFDYMDRYLRIERIEWRRFWDAGFTAQMWQTYRPGY